MTVGHVGSSMRCALPFLRSRLSTVRVLGMLLRIRPASVRGVVSILLLRLAYLRSECECVRITIIAKKRTAGYHATRASSLSPMSLIRVTVQYDHGLLVISHVDISPTT